MKKDSLSHLLVSLGLMYALTLTQCGGGGDGGNGGGSGTPQSSAGGSGQQVGVAPIVVADASISGPAEIAPNTASSFSVTPINLTAPYSIQWSSAAAQISFQPANQSTTSITASQAGTHTFTVTITDSSTPPKTISKNAQVIVKTAPVVNNRPTLTYVDVPSGNQPSVPVQIKILAQDPDGDPLTYKIRMQDINTTLQGQHDPIAAASSGASLTSGIELIHRVTFASASAQAYGPFIIEVTDSKGSTAQSNPFSIAVTTNQMIQNVSITGPISVLTGQYNGYTLNYFDQEGDSPTNIQWSATDLGTIGPAGWDTYKSIAWDATGSKWITVRFSDPQGRSYGPYYLGNINVGRSCTSNPSHTVYASLAPRTASWNGNNCYELTISAGGRTARKLYGNLCGTSNVYEQLSLFLSGTDIGNGTTASINMRLTSGWTNEMVLNTTQTYLDNYYSNTSPPWGVTSWSIAISAPQCQ